MKFSISILLRLVTFLLVGVLPCHADELPTDSIEISLLTCSPHQEVYSLYGHTAIRVEDKSTGNDFVVNYGMFSFDQPYFVLRFVFGLTDYDMGITNFERFRDEYSYYGSSVTQQTLDLTPDEKRHILTALEENSRPENVTYRYNYFFDNCTTRARDMLVDHLDGKVTYNSSLDSTMTFRSMIHMCNEDYPWARFGNDMLLGYQADARTSVSDRQFLPIHLMADFSTATIKTSDDHERPLIKTTREILPAGIQVVEDGFPLRPRTCFLILLIITLAVSLWEIWRQRVSWVFDALLMTVCGLAGIVLTAMIFSYHPTVSQNFQLLLLNPLPLLLAFPVARNTCRQRYHWWWKVCFTLIIIFFICNFIQKYAEGMNILALSLLTRCIIHEFFKIKKSGKKDKNA